MMAETSSGLLPGNFTKRVKTDCEGRLKFILSLALMPNALRQICHRGFDLRGAGGIRSGINNEIFLFTGVEGDGTIRADPKIGQRHGLHAEIQSYDAGRRLCHRIRSA